MNERIKELTKQAEEFSHWTNDGHTANYRINPEKFAELIVLECAELATKEYNNRGAIHGNDLLEHFGLDSENEVEYCPRCNAEWSGTSCGLDNCGWIVGVEE
jgi:hypothetical protein